MYHHQWSSRCILRSGIAIVPSLIHFRSKCLYPSRIHKRIALRYTDSCNKCWFLPGAKSLPSYMLQSHSITVKRVVVVVSSHHGHWPSRRKLTFTAIVYLSVKSQFKFVSVIQGWIPLSRCQTSVHAAWACCFLIWDMRSPSSDDFAIPMNCSLSFTLHTATLVAKRS